MKYQDMPNVQITGKIANNHILKQYISPSHTPYTIIMLYILRNNHALLYPVTFLGKQANQIAKDAQQGDLVTVNLAISPIYSKYNFNCSLIVNRWAFAENISNKSRNRTIKQNFPIIPDNYPTHVQNRSLHKAQSDVKSDASKHLAQAEVNPDSVEIIPPHTQSQEASSSTSTSSQATIHIKPHIISGHSAKSKKSTKSQSKSTHNDKPYDWMDEMNKDLGMTFDKMK